MSRTMIRRLALASLFLGTAFLGTGCSKVPVQPTPPPQSPETELTYAPVELDTTTFRVHFFWNGYDNDGEVMRFHLAVDADTLPDPRDWPSTTAKDTVLLFQVDPVKELKVHVFKIAAEDNAGNIDPTPARRSFSAKTQPPSSEIVKGPSAFNPTIGPNFTFEWSGSDPDGGETGGRVPVDSFQYQLLKTSAVADTATPPTHPPLPRFDQQRYVNLLRAAVGDGLLPPYDDWKWTGVRGTKLRFRNKTPGDYVFAIRAVDIAGATEKDIIYKRNIRHFTVTNRSPGPRLCVTSSVLNKPLDCAVGPEDFDRKQIQIFEGETISFAWSASAETYGGEIVGYTYAMDDTSTFPGLDPRLTGATFQPSVLPPGVHRLFVRAMDDGGLITNVVIPLLIVHPEFKDPGVAHSILFVDDSTGPGNAMTRVYSFPSDGEETDWWTLAQNGQGPLFSLGVPFQEWDTVLKADLDPRKQPEPFDLRTFTTVVWTTDFNNGGSVQTGLFKAVAGGNYSELQGYLRAGGTVILTGWNLVQNTSAVANYAYRNVVPSGMCASYVPGSREYNGTIFPRLFMGVDQASPQEAARRSSGANDFVAAVPTAYGTALNYPRAEIDTGITGTGAKWNTNPFVLAFLCATTSGSTTVTSSAAFGAAGQGVLVGMAIAGAGIPSGATVTAKASASSITISLAATATSTGSGALLSFYATNRLDEFLFPGLGTVEGWVMSPNFGCQVDQEVFRYEDTSVPIARPIYAYHGVPKGVSYDLGPSPREGLVCGIAMQSHDLGNTGGGIYDPQAATGRMVIFGFPLYFVKDQQAINMMTTAFAYVNASPTLP